MKVTIGIPTHRRPKQLEALFKSMLKHFVFPYEIIVWEDQKKNELTKKIIERYKNQFKKVNVQLRYYYSKDRKFIPQVRNQIISLTKGTILSFLDDDTEVTRDWLKSIIEPYSDEKVGSVGGPAIITDEKLNVKVNLRYDNKNINIINKYGESVGNGHRWIPPYPIETDWYWGANMSFRLKVLREINGFDPFDKLCEDGDAQVRVKKLGYKLVYHPQALVYHKRTPYGGNRLNNIKSYSGFYRIYFVRKNFVRNKFIVLLRLIFRLNKDPAPLLRIIAKTILYRDLTHLHQIKGYFDGLRFRFNK